MLIKRETPQQGRFWPGQRYYIANKDIIQEDSYQAWVESFGAILTRSNIGFFDPYDMQKEGYITFKNEEDAVAFKLKYM